MPGTIPGTEGAELRDTVLVLPKTKTEINDS